MKNWLANLFSPKQEMQPLEPADPLPDSFELALRKEKELQTLRMELDEAKHGNEVLKQEIERMRASQELSLGLALNNRMEALFTDLAGPASQILTQADLLENRGKPVQARDILSVARRIVRALERNGAFFEGKLGEEVEFDPNRHTPIRSDRVYQSGQLVIVRFSGVSYQGKMIYKVMVE
jgi:hypothetical protein